MKSAVAVIVLILLLSGCARKDSPPFHVGFLIIDIPTDQAVLTVAVWYPTQDSPEEYEYNDPHNTMSMVAFEGEPDLSHSPYPLVVYSHGYGAGALTGIYLAEHLASHGFVVAAPDHADDFAVTRIRGEADRDMSEYLKSAIELARSGKDFDRGSFSYRPKDISLVIDEIFRLNSTESLLQKTIDKEAVGAMGHSLGGYTVLMAGGIDQESDPHIDALVLLSAGVFMFEDEEYTSIAVPVMFMYGEKEGSTTRADFVNEKTTDTQRAYNNCPSPKFLLVIKGGNHFSFGQTVFQNSWPGMGSREGKNQADVICTYTLAFFQRYLQGDVGAERILETTDDRLSSYQWHIN